MSQGSLKPVGQAALSSHQIKSFPGCLLWWMCWFHLPSRIISWVVKIHNSLTLLQLGFWKKTGPCKCMKMAFGRRKRTPFLWFQLLPAGTSLKMLGLFATISLCCSLTSWGLSGSGGGPDSGPYLCHCTFELRSFVATFSWPVFLREAEAEASLLVFLSRLISPPEMLCNRLILCCLLFLFPLVFPSIRVFPSESQAAKVVSSLLTIF